MNAENTLLYSKSDCTCGARGTVHAADCRCHIVGERLASESALSRRRFLRNALAGGATAAALPLLGEEAKADLFKPSVEQQKQVGAQAAKEILQKYPVVRDERARHFNAVGSRLVNALSPNDRKWDYTFYVIQSNEINAFAVPGGNMFMYTGLMDRVKSDAEIAAVTGHEMTHVRHEHWAKAQSHNSKRELGIAVLLGLTRAGAAARTLASLADSVLTLHYSRGEEDDADAGGLANMVAAGYNPYGMVDLFNLLQSAAGGRGKTPEFLSDHPDTASRIRKTQERIRKLGNYRAYKNQG